MELGDVEDISNQIIAEYFIENSNEINGIKRYSKALKAVMTLGVGTLNLMIILPIIFSVLIGLASLYFLGLVFINNITWIFSCSYALS